MVILTFQCTSLSQLKEEMAAFLNGTLPPAVISGPEDLSPALKERVDASKYKTGLASVPISETLPENAATAPVQKRRGRKPKAVEQTVYESPTAESGESAADESPAIVQHTQAQAAAAASSANGNGSVPAQSVTKESVHQALQQVNVAVGLPKAREILQAFGVNRISEIKEDQFKPFIDKCNEAVALS